MPFAVELNQVSDILNKVNSDAAKLVAPFGGVINALPFLTPVAKDMMRNRPVDALLAFGEPIEGLLVDIVNRANDLSGKTSRPAGVQRVIVDMRIAQPEVDRLMSNSMVAFIRRLRTVNNYVIFLTEDPGHLAVAVGQIFVARGVQGARWMETFVRTVGQASMTGGPAAAGAAAGALAVTLLPGVAGLGAVPLVVAAISAGATLGSAAISAAGAIIGHLISGTVAVSLAMITARTQDLDRQESARRFDVEHQQGGGNLQDAVESSGIPGWAIGLGLLFGASLLVKK